jgi:nitrite reductase (cytochrome c-552)
MLLVRAHVEAKKAWDLGATEAQMKAPLQNIRHAQWRWDFVAASHGGPAHAPVECLRILSSGINKAQAARLQMTRILISLGHTEEVPFPPIETKAKAQEFIGLDMPAIIQKKNDWRANTLPAWIKNPV